MARALAERFQRWFEYERDAHAKVLRSLESVPAERRSAAEFRRAVPILANGAAARKPWGEGVRRLPRRNSLSCPGRPRRRSLEGEMKPLYAAIVLCALVPP